MALLAGSVACTVERADITPVSFLDIESTIPAHLDDDVARNAPVSFFFSEPIDPGSIGSTPIVVTSQGVRQGGAYAYDPLERRLTYTPRGRYRASLAYDASLEENIRGLRSGSPAPPTTVTFITSTEELDSEDPTPVDFELDVLPLFRRSCAFSACHAPPGVLASVDLSDQAGIEGTTIASSSHGWPGWILIDPGSAAWSYLVYKIIGEESVRGDPMPPGSPLPLSELETLIRWIDEGAKVDHEPVEP